MLSTSTPLILVVDDTEANRFVVTSILSKSGYRVIQAGTGREAVQAFNKLPDLVVLDVRLPDSTAFELARVLRARMEHQSTPILFISASFTGPGAHVQGLESGADGYLNHPVDPTLLLATVRSLLRARRAEDVERFLAEASEHLVRSLDPEDAARALATISIPRVADACVVLLTTDDDGTNEPIVHARPELLTNVRRAFEENPPPSGGEPVAPFRQQPLESHEQNQKRRQALLAAGLRHAVALPLIAR